MTLKPADLPEGSKVEITVEDGVFVARIFLDQYSRVYDGWGEAETVEEAIREALDEADEES